MSFLRHREIYRSDGLGFRESGARSGGLHAPTHRFDEFPAGYSLAGCAPAEPASASPAEQKFTMKAIPRPSFFQRMGKPCLAGCLTSGVHRGSIPLGTNLNGFSVTFNDIPGALFGVFDGPFDQSNVQVPWNLDVSSGKVEVKVHWKDDTSEVWSDPFEVDAALASPGIYMFPPGTTQAIVTNFKQAGDDVIAGSWAQPSGSIDPVVGQPAAIGGVVTLWCDGLGPVSPEPSTGDIPPAGTVPVTDKIVRVFVGGVEAQVIGAVLQPTSVGLNQINIFIPEGVTPGDAVPIVIEVECPDGTKLRSREDVTIAVRAAP